MKKRTIAVDFDGVIHGYSRGWQDGSIYDPPVPGCAATLDRLRKAGYHVLICTTRAADRTIDGVDEAGQAAQVAAYLDKHGIPYDEIFTGEKPIYTAIIDDRAVRFNPRPRWWQSFFGLRTAWDICESQLERLGILRPGEGEEPFSTIPLKTDLGGIPSGGRWDNLDPDEPITLMDDPRLSR